MLGWVGLGLLVIAGLAIVVEGIFAVMWAAGMTKRTQVIAERLKTERRMLESDLEKLRNAMEETKRLWRPYQRIIGWLQHPLVIALLASYSRRRRLLR
jgi:hypothetical protein